jgi:two-component system response regulator (stage 0 sporulation protein F)
MLDQSVKPKRILIVDDEATLVFFLKQGLQEANISCQVDVAPSGEDALTKLTYNRYDLLITDLKMPGISGFTLVEVARSLHSDIKVILMTAYGSREVLNEAKNLQVDGYLTKPFPTADLQDLASSVLEAEDHRHLKGIVTNETISVENEYRNTD